jgi:hypothetical protein
MNAMVTLEKTTRVRATMAVACPQCGAAPNNELDVLTWELESQPPDVMACKRCGHVSRKQEWLHLLPKADAQLTVYRVRNS